ARAQRRWRGLLPLRPRGRALRVVPEALVLARLGGRERGLLRRRDRALPRGGALLRPISRAPPAPRPLAARDARDPPARAAPLPPRRGREGRLATPRPRAPRRALRRALPRARLRGRARRSRGSGA